MTFRWNARICPTVWSNGTLFWNGVVCQHRQSIRHVPPATNLTFLLKSSILISKRCGIGFLVGSPEVPSHRCRVSWTWYEPLTFLSGLHLATGCCRSPYQTIQPPSMFWGSGFRTSCSSYCAVAWLPRLFYSTSWLSCQPTTTTPDPHDYRVLWHLRLPL